METNTNNMDNLEKKLENKEIKLKTVKEGKADIRQTNDSGTFSPFYNPAQELNRDISVLAIHTYFEYIKKINQEKLEKRNKKNKEKSKEEVENLIEKKTEKALEKKKLFEDNLENPKFKIIDVMSATGLRAMRYLREIDNNLIDKIYANDLDDKAVDLIKINALRNGDKDGKIQIFQKEASNLLYSQYNTLDVVDLDPYGSSVQLLDAAFVAAKNNGLILATFTDMQILCGNMPEVCYYRYGSVPFKKPYCHEVS